MSTTRWVISRRALGAKIISPTFQHRLEQAKMAEKLVTASKVVVPNKETPWPRSLQIVGYTVLAFTIPYTASVILVESRSMREWVESHLGEKIMHGIRWYWGEEEKRPYGPILEQQYKHQDGKGDSMNEEIQVSLIGKEDSAAVRWEQDRIQERIHSPVHVTILGRVMELSPLLQPILNSGKRIRFEPTAIEPDGMAVMLSGNIHIHDCESILNEMGKNRVQSIIQEESEKSQTSNSWMNQLALSFPEDEPSTDIPQESNVDVILNENQKTISSAIRSTTVWSAWHHFKATTSPLSSSSSTTQTNKTSYYDDVSLRMEEIQYKLSELQRNRNDPSCPRDRDDMQKEYNELRTELGGLKRRKLWRGFKSLIYLN